MPSLEELVNVLQAHKEYCGMRRHVVIKGLREGALLESIENGRNETESTGMKTTLKEVLNKMGTESMERMHGTIFLSIGEKTYNETSTKIDAMLKDTSRLRDLRKNTNAVPTREKKRGDAPRTTISVPRTNAWNRLSPKIMNAGSDTGSTNISPMMTNSAETIESLRSQVSSLTESLSQKEKQLELVDQRHKQEMAKLKVENEKRTQEIKEKLEKTNMDMQTMFEYLQQKIKNLNADDDEEMTPRNSPPHGNTAARKNEKRNRGDQTTPASVARPPQKKQQSQDLA